MTFTRFGLIVTGQGEERFLPQLFKLFHRHASRPACHFEVIRRIGQRSPRSSPRHQLEMVGKKRKVVPDRDMEDFGFPARAFLGHHGEHAHVILVDDLESARKDAHQEVFERYRKTLDAALYDPAQRRRAAVFFLVMMLEAYYFGDLEVLCEALQLEEIPKALCDVDVESIRHPKNDLKALFPGFDEIVHGERIVNRLDVVKVLEDPQRCAALRTMFAWCAGALGIPWGSGTGFLEGVLCPVTSSQLDVVVVNPP